MLVSNAKALKDPVTTPIIAITIRHTTVVEQQIRHSRDKYLLKVGKRYSDNKILIN